MNSEPPLIPVEPNPFWKENAQKLVGESVSTIEDAAKQLIAVNSLLEGIYFHAITFSDVKPVLNGWIAGIYLAPVALWLLSLIFAVLALSPENFRINIESTSASKEVFEEIVSRKYARLQVAEGFLILSFMMLFIAVAHYLLAVPVVKV